ncbi:hypothetical protein JS530_03030 [Bifidobacterium sp. LC6]|uniref:Uncharacterized protein n=1 Tax=Bifidobacterium colobi TaxID=2809026 RepID=A0ABS5UUS8_9BIFI|nr:hypothetical protein [Bifidobacterium colobi]MBT1174491.1 hypothetical protein [Bifidobacterium colobi]
MVEFIGIVIVTAIVSMFIFFEMCIMNGHQYRRIVDRYVLPQIQSPQEVPLDEAKAENDGTPANPR